MCNTIYLALGYECNHHCTCCPCTINDKKKASLEFGEIKTMFSNSKNNFFIISGGEPTVYSHFIDTIALLSRNNIIKVLSNGDKFSNKNFTDKFIESINIKNVSVTTTLHDYNAEFHEENNNSKGSFNRTIKGIKYIRDNGIHVTIKHCITPSNYNRLVGFFKYIYDNFTDDFDIQISGIDFVGMSEFEKRKALLIGNMNNYLNEAFDFIDNNYIHNKRKINCINIPLCNIDPVYWKYVKLKTENMYNIYISPKYINKNYSEQASDIGCFSDLCKKCSFLKYCSGSYKSAFELYQDNFVKPIKLIK